MEEEVKFNHFMPAQIRFSDVDQFGHVNNSVYFSLYDLAKTTYFKDVLVSHAIVVADDYNLFVLQYNLSLYDLSRAQYYNFCHKTRRD